MHSAEARNSYLEDELLIIRHSGEIPEVTMHGSIHFLTEDQTGPGLKLTKQELHLLQSMVVERYREIIFRDLDPANRDKGLYRGLARCVANWQRMRLFCGRANFTISSTRIEVRNLLRDFLENESIEVKQGVRTSSVNCCIEELEKFSKELGLISGEMPLDWHDLCHSES